MVQYFLKNNVQTTPYVCVCICVCKYEKYGDYTWHKKVFNMIHGGYHLDRVKRERTRRGNLNDKK